MRHTYPSTAGRAAPPGYHEHRASAGCPYGRGRGRHAGGRLRVDGCANLVCGVVSKPQSTENAVPLRRDSGVTWLNRQRAQVVRLGHPLLDVVVPDGGLRSGEVLVLCGTAGSGKTEMAYHIAARHAASGGAVVWVAAPGAGCLRGRRLLIHIESAVRQRIEAGQCTSEVVGKVEIAGGSSDVSQVELAVSGAAALVSSTASDSIEALQAVLTSPLLFQTCRPIAAQHTAPSNGDTRVNAPSSSSSRTHHSTTTPLLVVDGLGATQFAALYERVHCQETPLLAWVADAVQKHHCAVVMTDAMYPPYTAARSGVPPTTPATAASPTDASEAALYAAHTIRAFGQQHHRQRFGHNGGGGVVARGAPLMLKVAMVLQCVPLPAAQLQQDASAARARRQAVGGGGDLAVNEMGVAPTEAITVAVYEQLHALMHHQPLGRQGGGAFVPQHPNSTGAPTQFSHKAAVAFLVGPEGLRIA